MNNFFVVSKPSVSKTIGNINYSTFNNTPVPTKPTTAQVVAAANIIKPKSQSTNAVTAKYNTVDHSNVKAVSGISHLITKKHKVKQYRHVSGISHLLEDN